MPPHYPFLSLSFVLATHPVVHVPAPGSLHILSSPQALAEKILDYRLDLETGSGLYFNPEIADAIHQLWKDPIIPKIMDEHSSDFYLMDSAG
jgi:guanine nucleotide-binding protein subunit alpha